MKSGTTIPLFDPTGEYFELLVDDRRALSVLYYERLGGHVWVMADHGPACFLVPKHRGYCDLASRVGSVYSGWKFRVPTQSEFDAWCLKDKGRGVGGDPYLFVKDLTLEDYLIAERLFVVDLCARFGDSIFVDSIYESYLTSWNSGALGFAAAFGWSPIPLVGDALSSVDLRWAPVEIRAMALLRIQYALCLSPDSLR